MLLIIFLLIFLNSLQETRRNKSEKEIRTSLRESMKKGYMEGQIDALSGDIRIRKSETNYYFIRNPFDK